MHGPEHHVLVGSALLTAYKNCGGDLDLNEALSLMEERGKQVPGRCLRLLGMLRCRSQHWNLLLHPLKVNSSCRVLPGGFPIK